MTLINEAREKEIEAVLRKDLQKFLLELGSGFAFVGRQVPLRTDLQGRIGMNCKIFLKVDI